MGIDNGSDRLGRKINAATEQAQRGYSFCFDFVWDLCRNSGECRSWYEDSYQPDCRASTDRVRYCEVVFVRCMAVRTNLSNLCFCGFGAVAYGNLLLVLP